MAFLSEAELSEQESDLDTEFLREASFLPAHHSY